jgi:drug/metabolite transporter (DMT)-like permease
MSETIGPSGRHALAVLAWSIGLSAPAFGQIQWPARPFADAGAERVDALSQLFAVLAAFANAVNVVAQHVVSAGDAKDDTGFALARRLLTSPLWLFGGAVLIGAFVFQAVALHLGDLSVVQPLLVTELLFSLAVRRVWLGEAVSRSVWVAGATMCGALGIFLAVAEPRGGGATATSSRWLPAGLVLGALVVVLTVLARRGPPARRAALYGSASALVWAIEAAFIKSTTDTLTEFGVGGMFLHWPVYAVVVGGVVGTLLVQSALHVGPLTASQPLMVAVDPVVSIALGVWLYQERFTSDPLEVTVAAVAFAVMVAAIVVITSVDNRPVGPPA